MAIDITTSHYSDGTATVAGINVTGQGTTWSLLRPGDQYGTHRGFGVRIAEVIDDTHLTLAYDVPALYQTEADYEIQRTPYELGYMQGIQDLLVKLGNGNLDSFAGLSGLADKLPMFTGPGELALVSKIDLTSGVNFNVQVDNLAGRAAYDNEATGFAVLVANVGDGRSAIYAKRSGGAADWSDPAYLTGPAITLDVTEVDEVPYGTPPDVTLTPIAGGYNLAFEIPRGMLIEPGTTTTLPPGSDAVVDFVPVTGGYRLDISLPKGDTGDIDGVTPFWVTRLSSDGDAAAARLGLGAGDVLGMGSSVSGRIALWSGASGKQLTQAGLSISDLVRGPGASTANRYARYGDNTGQVLIDGPNGIPNADLATMVQAAIKGRASGAGTGAPVDLTPAQVRAITGQGWITLSQTTFSAGTTEFVSLLIGSYSYLRMKGVLFPSAAAPLGLRLSQDGGGSWRQDAADYSRVGGSVVGANAPANQSSTAPYYYLNTAENIFAGEPIDFQLNFENAVGGARIVLECSSAHTGSSTGSRISSRTHCLTAFGGGVGGIQLTMPGATFAGRLLLEGAL